MKKLVLHIGTEKTGTTSIQSMLSQNRQRFKAQGFHVLECAGEENHRLLPSIFIAKSDPFLKLSVNESGLGKAAFIEHVKKTIADEIHSLPEHVHTVITSSEHCQSRLKTAEEVAALHNFLAQFFDEIKVVCYVREQSAMCTSLYSTALKVGYKESIDEFAQSCHSGNVYYNHLKMLDLWSDAFGHESVCVKRFDFGEFVNNSLLDDFLSQIDTSLIDIIDKNVPRENESLNFMGQILSRSLNEAIPAQPERPIENQLRHDLKEFLYNNFKGKGAPLPYEKIANIYNDFEQSNLELNQRYLGGDGNAFPLPKYDESQGSQSVTSEQISAFAHLIEFIYKLGQRDSLEANEVELLRDAAIKLEDIDMNMSLRLMHQARLHRPTGALINKKIGDYQKILAAKKL
ncbi:TPA: sulfotransferase domain-containing protein [Vibrio parahaemolyticus]|uniref:sulfotransferase domain-containing protein n=4 Tax=Vibrio parahaemolyticus TaxID=670 RepID=UPI001121F260|nr:sulfotransferase domain-containing protein [Vibrio parahaemolyticus]EHR0552777.1 sulfotransferase domain-containing protein [Vibrio parahaemolyticus]ELA6984481.1 sulfotransferase domain-containing protein [Vibrio parahaemolyticus]ELA9389856.1 sulfotransferase domain-containing protein [Vibrio parahaemolyticus]MBM4889228.1 sulfotransferase domain-containing protein [Vibrio parahaemolyticus]MBM5098107.1 sulfotransferase domain-containing protein [Vibrio parahaemolyticus]